MAYLDRELRQMLERKGADEQLVEFASEQLSHIYSRISDSEQYQFSVHLPAGLSGEQRGELEDQINAGLEDIRKDNHRLTVELVAELLLARVRLFQSERAD